MLDYILVRVELILERVFQNESDVSVPFLWLDQEIVAYESAAFISKKLLQSKFNPCYLILILGAMNNIFHITLD